MIRNILHIIVLFVLPISASAQFSLGGRTLALGSATVSLKNDSWAVFSNPANLNGEKISAGFYGLRNYGFAELTDISAFGTLPAKFGITGIGFHRYGDDLFNETRIRAAYKVTIQQLDAGIILNYNQIAFGGPYGSGSALGIDIGLGADITERLRIGAKAGNINQPEYKFEVAGESLRRDLSIGLSYKMEEKALFVFDVVKDVRFPVAYHAGMEIQVVKAVMGRVGITTEPVTYSAGFGYQGNTMDVNVAVQHHQLLGWSPGFDFTVSF